MIAMKNINISQEEKTKLQNSLTKSIMLKHLIKNINDKFALKLIKMAIKMNKEFRPNVEFLNLSSLKNIYVLITKNKMERVKKLMDQIFTLDHN